MVFNGYVEETPFEQECRLLGLDAKQVAFARCFGRDMIAEVLAEECSDNGCGTCHCPRCDSTAPAVDNKPLTF